MGEIVLPTVEKSKFENPWQIQIKSVEEKWAHILENELYTDTVLWVGGSEEPPVAVPCHKVILILNSPVFESMLSSRWTSAEKTNSNSAGNSKDEINLPEDDSSLIKVLISCFYNGKLTNVEETLELLLLAKKYICPHVVTKCNQYLRTASNERNIVQIYQTACLVEEADLIKHAENYILSKACHLVRLGEFSRFNYEQLKYFLSHDDLNVDEVDLFNAVFRWGQLEVTRKELDPNKSDNISCVLEHIFPLIRFPCMSLEDFTLHVVSKNVLPLEQTVQVYKFLTTPVTTRKDSISLEPISPQIAKEEAVIIPAENNFQFNTQARSRKIFSYIFKRLKGYGFNFGRKWQNFAFQVDHDIKMVSIGFYRSVRPNVELTVGVRILNFEMTEVFGQVKDEIVSCTLDEDIFYVKFPQPIRIAKETLYTISYKIQGEDTLYKYGEPLQVQLACSTDLKLSFCFKEALSDSDMDQVPEFCFQL